MPKTEYNNAVTRLVELLLNDQVISDYAITRTNGALSRACLDSEDIIDHEWWNMHNSIIREILTESYLSIDLLGKLDLDCLILSQSGLH